MTEDSPALAEPQEVEVLDYALGEEGAEEWPDDLSEEDIAIYSNEGPPMSADTLAVYRPWHLHGDRWGIVVHEEALLGYTAGLARAAGGSPARFAPFALRQILAHEHAHFAFEVAASQIEDILGEPRYITYLAHRYGAPNRWSDGPLEEVVATWAELAFAHAPSRRGLGRKPRGYAAAVEQFNQRAPAGYRDFALMADYSRAERIIADVASLVARRELWAGRWWPGTVEAERAQVPVRWEGSNPSSVFGVLPKTVAACSVRVFERWARRRAGAELRRGGKHGKVAFPNGRSVPYTTGSHELYPPEAQRIAQALGLRNMRELFEHVAQDVRPGALASAS